MNVLIIGGLGFIGSHLAEQLLKKEHEITIISRSKSKISNIKGFEDNVRLVIKDVRNIGDFVKNFDVIFHLAGTTDNYAIVEDDLERDIEANCKGTLYLLDACRKYNPKVRIIFASSFFVIGKPKELPVDESSECNPSSLYPATRLCGEHICKIYSSVFNLDVIIARFANVFGAKELADNKKKAAFNYMINMAVHNHELTLYDSGDFVRDYIYVTDVADACITLMEKGETNEIYHIGRGEGIKIKRLFNMVVDVIGKGKVVSIPTPTFHKKVGVKDFYFDISKIKALGWKPKIQIQKGIKLTADYYLELENQVK